MLRNEFKHIPTVLLLIAILLSPAVGVVNGQPRQTGFVENQDSSSVQAESPLSDSLHFLPQPDDTLAADSLMTKKKDSSEGDAIDTVIVYSADSIFFGVNRRYTVLEKKAQVNYRDIELNAGRIIVDWDNNVLKAMSIQDTTWSDSVSYTFDSLAVVLFDSTSESFVDTVVYLPVDSTIMVIIDTIKTVESPRFKQSGDEVLGDTMTFNLKTKKGFVIRGKTDFGDGYYRGNEIKRVEQKVMNVGEGDFTTCELDTPHFHFHSKQMRLIVKDKVIAKPVVLYFADVPIFPLPFGIFPSKTGRQSGIIFPHYGESGSQGRFFRNLGYYFAPSSYWDAKATLDYYERHGILMDGDVKYRKLYRLDGRISSSYTRMNQERRWDLNVLHNQTLTPTAKLLVKAKYVSDASYYQDLSSNPQDRMERIIRSDATYRDSYKFGGSIEMNLHHEENLDEETTNSTIPRVKFRLGQKSFFPQKKDQEEVYWYNKIYFSAGSNLTNQQAKDRNTLTTVMANPDTTSEDSTITITNYDYYWNKQGALRNSYGINTSQTFLKYFSVNPSIGIAQDFTDYRTKYYSQGGDIKSYKQEGYFVRHTFSFNTGLNTKLYGTFPVDIGTINSFRHVISPSISYRYQPDFSDEHWGYYQYLENNGLVEKKDMYAGQSMIGGTGASEAQSLNLSFGNLFQMKRVKIVEGEEEVLKTDLFNLNSSTSYNIVADKNKWGSISTSFRAQPIQGTNIGPLLGLTVDMSTTHSIYANNAAGAVTNTFYYADNDNWKAGKLLRLTYFNLNSSFRFAAQKKDKKKEKEDAVEFVESDEWEETDEDVIDENSPLYIPPIETSDRFRRDFNFKPKEIPWDMTTGLRYTWNKSSTVADPDKTLWLENSLNLNLTTNWSVSYTNRIDLVTKEIVSSGFTFYRDMHCWEGRFIWNPTGIGQGFFLKINVKSPGLRDLKVEKRKGVGGFLGY